MDFHEGWMRSVQLRGPRKIRAVEVPLPSELGSDEVEVRLELAGICGSDRPGFLSGADKDGEQPIGYPTHECIGTVLRSSGDASLVGARVIAIPNRDAGLSQVFHAPIAKTHVLAPSLPPMTAILVQPLASVLAAIDRLGDVRGKRAAVIGLGPIGITFGFVLRDMGVASLDGFDPQDRSTAPFIGVFDSIERTPPGAAGYEIVVEAVGHDLEVVNTAVEAAAFGATVLYFGVPDEDVYPFEFKRFFRKCLQLIANVQPDWQTYLPRAEKYLVAHPELGALVTDVVPVRKALQAFEIAFGGRASGHGKVLISVDDWL